MLEHVRALTAEASSRLARAESAEVRLEELEANRAVISMRSIWLYPYAYHVGVFEHALEDFRRPTLPADAEGEREGKHQPGKDDEEAVAHDVAADLHLLEGYQDDESDCLRVVHFQELNATSATSGFKWSSCPYPN